MTDHTDLIAELRRMAGGYGGNLRVANKAADALAALVKDVESLDLIRLDLNIEARRLTMERAAALARVKRLEDVLLKINDRFIYKQRGSTHWDGCEKDHPECAMAREIEAALAEGDKP